jgi:hypothetical protein
MLIKLERIMSCSLFQTITVDKILSSYQIGLLLTVWRIDEDGGRAEARQEDKRHCDSGPSITESNPSMRGFTHDSSKSLAKVGRQGRTSITRHRLRASLTCYKKHKELKLC